MEKEEVKRRRELVDSLDRIGMKTGEIMEYVQKASPDVHGKGRFAHLLAGVKNSYRTIRKDLEIVRKARKKLLYTKQAEKAKRNYIATQEEILKRAVANKDFKVASECADKIAKARGVTVKDIIADINEKSTQKLILYDVRTSQFPHQEGEQIPECDKEKKKSAKAKKTKKPAVKKT